MESAQTHSDRDVLDLRRKMDKLDMQYQEKIEKLQEAHEKEICKYLFLKGLCFVFTSG